MKLPADIKSIIVFRALQMGDMLCVIPAIRTLRYAYPDAHTTLAGLPWAKSFTARFYKYFDDFIWFPGYPGLPEQELNPLEFTTFLEIIQHKNFDLALQMHGNGYIVNSMTELFRARITAGFFKPGDYAPNLNYFMEYPDDSHEIERHLELMSFLGIENQGNELEFPVVEQNYAEYNSLELPVEDKKYVCIHTGSRGLWRQ